MNFLGIFWAQNDRLVIGFLMDTQIFEFQPNLCLWQLFKEGNCQGILANFFHALFQTPITWAWSGLFGLFLCSK